MDSETANFRGKPICAESKKFKFHTNKSLLSTLSVEQIVKEPQVILISFHL